MTMTPNDLLEATLRAARASCAASLIQLDAAIESLMAQAQRGSTEATPASVALAASGVDGMPDMETTPGVPELWVWRSKERCSHSSGREPMPGPRDPGRTACANPNCRALFAGSTEGAAQ